MRGQVAYQGSGFGVGALETGEGAAGRVARAWNHGHRRSQARVRVPEAAAFSTGAGSYGGMTSTITWFASRVRSAMRVPFT